MRDIRSVPWGDATRECLLSARGAGSWIVQGHANAEAVFSDVLNPNSTVFIHSRIIMTYENSLVRMVWAAMPNFSKNCEHVLGRYVEG